MSVIELELPTEIFNVAKMQKLLDARPSEEEHENWIWEKYYKSVKVTTNYINQYYFEIDNGNYYKYDTISKNFIFTEKNDFKTKF